MTLQRVLGTWCLLAVLMSANGIFRELVLRPSMAPGTADLASAALGIAIILAVTFLAFRIPADYPWMSLLLISATLVGLTVVFEFVMGRYVDHKSWTELLANYRVWEGRPWPLVLATLAATPFLWRGRGL